MKEHQMYPHNPNSAESILTNKLKDVTQAWVEGQRAIVLDAMNEYAQQEVLAYKVRLKSAIGKRMNEVDPVFTLAYYDLGNLIDTL